MKKIVFLLCLSILFGMQVNAQGWLEKVGKKAVNTAKQKVENRAAKKAGEATDKALDGLEGKDNQKTDTEETVEGTNKKGASDNQKSEKLTATSNYDFVAGDKVLLYEDFSQDAVGDFPALWTTNKSGEINTLSIAPGNWLNLNATEGNWWLLKPIEFPKNFIVEFDVVPKKGAPRYAAAVTIYGENRYKEMSDPYNGSTGLIVNIAKTGWETQGLKSGNPKVTGSSTINPVEEEKVNHVIIWVQNRRVRIYHKGEKVLDMPTNLYEGSKFTRFGFMLYRGASSASYVSNIKITTASPDTRSKLLTEGKLVTYGIYFDVNKDVVKAESFGTMKSIADVLKENPDVRIKIVGHTDSDGDNAKNLDLSQRRAKSVMNELVKVFGIDASRMETDGMGETKPIAPNDTPSNKALNRRVEFVKL